MQLDIIYCVYIESLKEGREVLVHCPGENGSVNIYYDSLCLHLDCETRYIGTSLWQCRKKDALRRLDRRSAGDWKEEGLLLLAHHNDQYKSGSLARPVERGRQIGGWVGGWAGGGGGGGRATVKRWRQRQAPIVTA